MKDLITAKDKADLKNIWKILATLIPALISMFKKANRRQMRKFLRALNQGTKEDVKTMNKILSDYIGYHVVRRLENGNYEVRRGFIWDYYQLKKAFWKSKEGML